MPLEFRTKQTSAHPTVIVGVGRLAAWGAGGIPVDVAAEAMHEFKNQWDEPLEGKQLEKAARKWAATRNLVVVSTKDRPPLTRQSATTGEPEGDADPNAENQEEVESE